MLQTRKESVIDATGSEKKISKQVELKSKACEGVHESTHVESVDTQSSTSDNDTPLD